LTHALSSQGISRTASNSENLQPPLDSFSDFDAVISARYACTRFQPYSSDRNPNPLILSQALHCLDISRRSPSGFNAQPYRAIVVSSPEAKENLSKYCLGRNRNRVLDSDCTVVFLADLECGRDWKWWKDSLQGKSLQGDSNKWKRRKAILLMMLFSSGYPIPRIFRSIISFGARFAFSVLSLVTRRKLLLPSLTNAETWSVKNTMLCAMTYMLSCTSHNIATCPMEGYNAGGIKKALKIPRRFSIPLIVSTGVPFESSKDIDGEDDTGVSHGKGNKKTLRFPFENVVFGDYYGSNIATEA